VDVCSTTKKVKMKTLRAALHLHEVKRYHMINTKTTQDVAQHSFRVAFIAKHIAENAKKNGLSGVDPHLAFYLGACHDLDEMTTGDIPSHVKIALRKVGVEVAKLAVGDGFEGTPTPYKWVIKAADLMESMYWCELNVDNEDIRACDVERYINQAFTDFCGNLSNLFSDSDSFDRAIAAVRQTLTDLDHINHGWNQDYNLSWPVAE
jgi:5'-deoxynucleotidase YfbR-like HD superfamily hydrolase